jgi:hypothetical protein
MPTTSRSAGYGEGMREAFAHTAVLDLAAGADVRAAAETEHAGRLARG